MPRARGPISPKNRDFPSRFARKLRELIGDRSTREVSKLVAEQGVEVTDRAVEAWLRGQRLPKLRDIEKVAKALGLDDYRDLLPEPLATSKSKSG
jgi:hypothetical protein